RPPAGGARAVEEREQLEPGLEPPPGAIRLEADELLERVVRRREVAAEALEILSGQVHAALLEVLADVAEDVRQLEGDAEIVGVDRSGLTVARLEDAERQPSHPARHAAAVRGQSRQRPLRVLAHAPF